MSVGEIMMIKAGRGHGGVVLNAPNRGFTLLELLISLTALGMIVVIMFGAFRVGVRAWEKGEKEVDLRQRQRLVLDLIRHQLASICATDVTDREGKPFLFKGDRKSLEFVSHIPLTPGSPPGPVYVIYAVGPVTGEDKESLHFYERSLVSPDRETGAREPEQADFSELLSGVESIAFEYLKSRPDEQESPWQERWEPEGGENGFPRAIRIRLQENDKKAPIYVIAAAGG